jgi:hypothetical protein
MFFRFPRIHGGAPSLHFSQRLADCGAMARCAVSESCAVVDTKGEYRRAHRDSVERVIIFDASARISG